MLRVRQRRAGVERLLGLEEAAGIEVRRLAAEAALDRVDVIPVDGEIVVERRLDRGKEARPRGDEILLREPGARREQPMIRPRVVARHRVEVVGEGRGRHRVDRSVGAGSACQCAPRESAPGAQRRKSASAPRIDIDQHGPREIAAAALQHAHSEPPFVRREREPQRRGRCDRVLAGTPPQDAPGAALARGDRESPQHALVARAEPRERGAAFGRAQRLLVRPQLVRARSGSGRSGAARDRAPRRRARARRARAAVRSRRRRGGPPAGCASAGSVSRISPMPSRASRISVSAPAGQPRPGSTASSSGKPEGIAAGSGAQSPPRQIAGFARTAASAALAGASRGASCSAQSAPPPIAFAARRSSSSGGTSSTCVARYQW